MLRFIFPTVIFIFLVTGKLYGQSDTAKIPPEADLLVNPLQEDTKAPMRGARIYNKVCWTCHGDNGKGNGPQAAEIETRVADFNDPQVVNRTDGALFWWIQHGGNDMQPFKDALTDEEIWMVVTYIRYIQNK